MTKPKPWWRLVHYRPDGTDGESEDLWTERSARNTLAMARKAGLRVRLELWTPRREILADDGAADDARMMRVAGRTASA
jgi:hypothetical protein